MLIDPDTPARKERGVDGDQTLGCPMVLCTTGRTSVREMIRHIANDHGVSLIKRHDIWALDLTEKEINEAVAWSKTKATRETQICCAKMKHRVP